MTWVSVNGETYHVRGGAARSQFHSVLAACDADAASYAFDQWRGSRRATNITAALGLFVFWPVLIATPFTAIAAGAHRGAVVSAIRGSSPPAK